jgi:hypothetical protein
MRIPEKISDEDRQEFLKNYLDGWNLENYLWFLNPIFNVNFPDTGEYSDMDTDDEQLIRKSVFKILCFKVFQYFWIILIDDMEFSDNDSLEMFDFLFELRNVFLVFTVGRRRKPTADKIRIMGSSFVKRYRLEPLEPNQLKRLTCQNLKVVGFSRELERYFPLVLFMIYNLFCPPRFIYTKSNGNPGWIKIFLRTLTESAKLEICTVTKEKALISHLTFADKDNLDDRSNSVAILNGKISEDDFITDLTVESK